jgi:SAM-dependent methyltransferase
MTPLFFALRHWKAAPAEARGAVKLLGVKPRAALLDLCCGQGRHSLELARMGFRVTAVDRTAEYLAEAERRAAEEGLAVEFVRDDMRRFARPGAFDGAVNLSTSFGYFEDPADDRRVLVNLHRSLRDGARVLIEMMDRSAVARDFRPHDRYVDESGMTVIEERSLEGDGSLFRKKRTVILPGGDRRRFEVVHRLYFAEELSALLVGCGFDSVRTYGDLTGAAYDDRARSLVAVAVR